MSKKTAFISPILFLCFFAHGNLFGQNKDLISSDEVSKMEKILFLGVYINKPHFPTLPLLDAGMYQDKVGADSKDIMREFAEFAEHSRNRIIKELESRSGVEVIANEKLHTMNLFRDSKEYSTLTSSTYGKLSLILMTIDNISSEMCIPQISNELISERTIKKATQTENYFKINRLPFVESLISALGSQGKNVLPMVFQGIKSESNFLLTLTKEISEEIKSPKIVPILIDKLESSEKSIKLYCLEKLGSMKAQSAIEPIEKLLDDKSKKVRRTAEKVMESLQQS